MFLNLYIADADQHLSMYFSSIYIPAHGFLVWLMEGSFLDKLGRESLIINDI